jgi:hypothetical protein
MITTLSASLSLEKKWGRGRGKKEKSLRRWMIRERKMWKTRESLQRYSHAAGALWFGNQQLADAARNPGIVRQ